MTLQDDEPDYTTYSLRDLRDVERRIDRSRFPERYARLREEISRRANSPQGQGDAGGASATFDFPHYEVHRRTSAFLIGGMAATNLLISLFGIATQGLDQILANPGLSPRLVIGALLVLALTVVAAVFFHRGERWSRYLLWPAAVLTTFSFDGRVVIGIYVLWVLWRSREESDVLASSTE